MIEHFDCNICDVSSKDTNQQAVFECSECGFIFAEYDNIDAFKVAERKISTCLIKGRRFVTVNNKQQLKSLAHDDVLTFPDKVNVGVGALDILSGIVKLFKI